MTRSVALTPSPSHEAAVHLAVAAASRESQSMPRQAQPPHAPAPIAPGRQQLILDVLDQRGSAKIAELAELLGVSEMTVHRDLRALEGKGALKKVHGGALARQLVEVPYGERLVKHHEAKVAVAELATSLIKPNMSLYCCPGSTVYELAARLSQPGLKVFTNSLPTATALARAGVQSGAPHDVTLAGGKVMGFAEALVGQVTEEQLRRQFFHYAVIAVTGVDLEGGLSVYTEPEARVVRAAMQAARKTLLLTDASKYGLIAGPAVAPLYAVHTVVCDGMPQDYRAYCDQHDIDVLYTPSKEAQA